MPPKSKNRDKGKGKIKTETDKPEGPPASSGTSGDSEPTPAVPVDSRGVKRTSSNNYEEETFHSFDFPPSRNPAASGSVDLPPTPIPSNLLQNMKNSRAEEPNYAISQSEDGSMKGLPDEKRMRRNEDMSDKLTISGPEDNDYYGTDLVPFIPDQFDGKLSDMGTRESHLEDINMEDDKEKTNQWMDGLRKLPKRRDYGGQTEDATMEAEPPEQEDKIKTFKDLAQETIKNKLEEHSELMSSDVMQRVNMDMFSDDSASKDRDKDEDSKAIIDIPDEKDMPDLHQKPQLDNSAIIKLEDPSLDLLMSFNSAESDTLFADSDSFAVNSKWVIPNNPSVAGSSGIQMVPVKQETPMEPPQLPKGPEQSRNEGNMSQNSHYGSVLKRFFSHPQPRTPASLGFDASKDDLQNHFLRCAAMLNHYIAESNMTDLKERFDEIIHSAYIPFESNNTTRESFPMPISEETWNLATTRTFLALHNENTSRRFTAPYVLFNTNQGCAEHLHTLCAAVARHDEADLLVVDMALFNKMFATFTEHLGSSQPSTYSKTSDVTSTYSLSEFFIPPILQRMQRNWNNFGFQPPYSEHNIISNDLSSCIETFSHSLSGSTGERVVLLSVDKDKKDTLPLPGSRGTILATIKEGNGHAAVKFDKPFNGGTSLGGLCNECQGAFVPLSCLASDEANQIPFWDFVFIVFCIHAYKRAVEHPSNSKTGHKGRPLFVCLKDVEHITGKRKRAMVVAAALEYIRLETGLPLVFIGTSSLPSYALDMRPSENAELGDTISLAFIEEGLRQDTSPLVRLISLFTNGKSKYSAYYVGSKLNSDMSKLDSVFSVSGSGQSNNSSETKTLPPDVVRAEKVLLSLFNRNFVQVVPAEGREGSEWRDAQELAADEAVFQKNKGLLQKYLDIAQAEVSPEDWKRLCFSRHLQSANLEKETIAKAVSFAVAHRLHEISAHTEDEEKPDAEKQDGAKIKLRRTEIQEGLELFSGSLEDARAERLRKIKPENTFEEGLLSCVVSPEDASVSFDDVGALEDVKDTLRELVFLPLRRPELYRRGTLAEQTKGILLFGPPGTGKTMLARAVATECGANFLNISAGSIGSMWLGDTEHYVRAIFTLASKLSPCVIFVDEVDSLLGRRDTKSSDMGSSTERGRKMKNEFLSNWDGLRTRKTERVIVLGATNRPMDLDEAALRRFGRRVLVDLPNLKEREAVFKTVLKGELLGKDVNFSKLAKMTDGYSSSDITNVCITAAYGPIRELLDKEKNEQHPTKVTTKSSWKQSTTHSSDDDDTEESDIEEDNQSMVELRPLNFSDFELAISQVSRSVDPNDHLQRDLREWNDHFGDSGNGKPIEMPYFL